MNYLVHCCYYITVVLLHYGQYGGGQICRHHTVAQCDAAAMYGVAMQWCGGLLCSWAWWWCGAHCVAQQHSGVDSCSWATWRPPCHWWCGIEWLGGCGDVAAITQSSTAVRWWPRHHWAVRLLLHSPPHNLVMWQGSVRWWCGEHHVVRWWYNVVAIVHTVVTWHYDGRPASCGDKGKCVSAGALQTKVCTISIAPMAQGQ